MTHLRIVLPLEFHEGIREYCQAVFAPHLPATRLSGSFIARAQPSTVSDYDQALNAPFILEAVLAAERDGCDGVFIDVALDTGLFAAKAAAGIPVVGALEATVGMAQNICSRFSILAINQEEVPVHHRLSREYGFAERLVSVEPIDIAVMALRDDSERTLDALRRATERAAARGAGAVILGCTAMSWAARELQTQVQATVLDTNLIGLYALNTQVALGIRPSRLEFQTPSGLRPLKEDELATLRELTFDIRAR